MALIKTIEEFRKHVRVNKSTPLETIMPDILLVERDQIKKHLGPEFYKELHGKYTDGTLTDLQKELLELVQFALANLAMLSYMAVNQVQLSDAGFIKSEQAAFRYQVRELKLNFIAKGYNGLESVLEFLEEHKNHLDFAKWATSSAAVVFRQFFINSAAEFSKEYNINGSRLTYLSLLSIIRKVEPFLLEPVLGPAFYGELKAEILSGEVKPENTEVLERFIRPAVAHFTVVKALPERSFKFTGESVTLNLEELVDDTSRGTSVNADAFIGEKIKQAFQDGQAYLVKLKDYLNQNATAEKYPTYFTSSLYTPPTDTAPVVFRNNANTKVFAFI
jgi:hypothetical protein